MDLTQQKLVKSEWEFLEVPVDAKEKNILNIIYMNSIFKNLVKQLPKNLNYQLKLKNYQKKRRLLKRQI